MTTNGKTLELTWSSFWYPRYYICNFFGYYLAIFSFKQWESTIGLQEMVLLVCFTCRYGGECVHFIFFSWQIQGYCSLSYSLKRKTCHMYHTLKSCILKHAPFHRSHSPRFLLCKINTLIFSPPLLNKPIFLTLLK